MTQPAQSIRLNPPAVREHATRLSKQGEELLRAVRQHQMRGTLDGASTPVDELVHAFLNGYKPRAQQAEERALATAGEFVRTGETAVKLVDLYERVDAETATDFAREQGLLPPR